MSGLKILLFVKGQYVYFAISIKGVIFNLERWLWIITNHTNTLVNLLQISPEWCEILDSLYYHTSLKLHQKSLGQPLRKWITSSQIYVHESPMACSYLFPGHILVYHQDIYVKYQPTRLSWYHQNPYIWKHSI